MSKICKNCGAELPDDASFCPHCAHSQIERTEVKPLHPWRKKVLIALGCVLVLAAAAAAILLPHRPQTFDNGGAYITYTDKDGTYELLISSYMGDIRAKSPEEKRTLSLSKNDRTGIQDLLGVYQDGQLVDAETFLAKTESVTLEVTPDENGCFTVEVPSYKEDFAPAILDAGVYFPGSAGTNRLIWTLTMKNGDIIRLTQTLEVIPLMHQVYTAQDTALDTLEDLTALLERIDAEVDPSTVVDIYLPAVTYTGDFSISSRAVNLYGCADGSGRTVIDGHLRVESDAPEFVMLSDLDFVGTSGTGLTASASVDIWNCSFTGYDIGALVSQIGMICADTCTFCGNRIGFSYNADGFTRFSDEMPNCLFEDNGIAIQFARLPRSLTISYPGTTFSGNGTDIDNLIDYPIDTSGATFE